MLDASIIQPSASAFFLPMVMFHKTKGSWCMFPNYKEINKMTIKYRFPNPLINELLDELHGIILITKLNPHSGYL